MQFLELNLDWAQLLTGVTGVVWLACMGAFVVSGALLAGFISMLVSTVRKEARVPAWSEFMGFGRAAARREAEGCVVLPWPEQKRVNSRRWGRARATA